MACGEPLPGCSESSVPSGDGLTADTAPAEPASAVSSRSRTRRRPDREQAQVDVVVNRAGPVEHAGDRLIRQRPSSPWCSRSQATPGAPPRSRAVRMPRATALPTRSAPRARAAVTQRRCRLDSASRSSPRRPLPGLEVVRGATERRIVRTRSRGHQTRRPEPGSVAEAQPQLPSHEPSARCLADEALTRGWVPEPCRVLGRRRSRRPGLDGRPTCTRRRRRPP